MRILKKMQAVLEVVALVLPLEAILLPPGTAICLCFIIICDCVHNLTPRNVFRVCSVFWMANAF